MRPRAPGMSNFDEVILEFLDSLGSPNGEPVLMSPRVLKDNLESRDLVDYSESSYSRRLQKLEERGFLGRTDTDAVRYYITEKGSKYVAGDLDPDEFEDLRDTE